MTRKIHWNYIPRDRVRKEHILSILGHEFSNEEKMINKTVDDVTSLKVGSLDFFREKVKKIRRQRLLKERIKTDSGEVVHNLRELRTYITKVNTIRKKFFVKLFNILYGVFDLTEDWATKIERVYMSEKCLE